jgi:cytochrome b561
MLKNTSTTYGSIAKLMHWLMALLIIAMFMVAYTMINSAQSGFSDTLYNLHKATGLLLFSLLALRLLWRFRNVQPRLPPSIPMWQRQLANCNIAALYFLMIAMPITGYFMSTLGNHAISFYGIFTFSPLADQHAASAFFTKAPVSRYSHEKFWPSCPQN